MDNLPPLPTSRTTSDLAGSPALHSYVWRVLGDGTIVPPSSENGDSQAEEFFRDLSSVEKLKSNY